MAARKHSRARLTPAAIEALRPRPARYDVVDPAYAGLAVRVHPTGAKVFRWRAKRPGRVVVLGPWAETPTAGHLTLHEARTWHEKLVEARRGGEGALEGVVAAIRRQLAPRPAPSPAGDRRTFATAAEEWYRDDITKNRKHPEDVRAMLDNDLLPVLGPMALDAITTRDCRDTIRRIVTGEGRPGGRAAPVHAGKVLSTLKQFFGWAQVVFETDRDPAAALRGRHVGVEVNVSDRCLDHPKKRFTGEVVTFWRSLDAAVAGDSVATVERPDPRTGKVQKYEQHVPTLEAATAAALKLLLLTAVRTGELLKARWEHVDLDAKTWTIPVANQKLTKAQERKGEPFVIPLSPTAVALFKELKELSEKVLVPDGEGGKVSSPWVMASVSADGGHYTEKALGRAMRRLQAGKAPAMTLPGGEASPHDLRRTARTHLAKLRVPHWIVERCLNHSLGKIAATYDQHDYFDERQEALEKWDAYVQRLLDPAASNVVVLPAATGGAR